MMAFTIGQAARTAGVNVETIRFYERRGLIRQPPKPRTGGYRSYDEGTVERIRFIRQAQEIGFSLREIGDLLSLKAAPKADCSDVRARAVAKREEVERKIAHLKSIRAALDQLIASCPGGGALRACTILEFMETVRSHPSEAASRRRSKNAGRRDIHSTSRKGTKAMKTAVLTIDGMHCDGCARTIEALVSREAGVRKVEASFKERGARVLFDPKTITVDRLVAVIEKGGFRAAVQAS